MPRKPKLPPPIIRVESLSTGRELRHSSVPDELGEGTVGIVPDLRPERELKTGREILDDENRAKLAQHKLNLVKGKLGHLIGMVEVKPVVHVAPQGMRVAGTFKGKDGREHVLSVPLPKWRRGTLAPIVDKPKKPKASPPIKLAPRRGQ